MDNLLNKLEEISGRNIESLFFNKEFELKSINKEYSDVKTYIKDIRQETNHGYEVSIYCSNIEDTVDVIGDYVDECNNIIYCYQNLIRELCDEHPEIMENYSNVNPEHLVGILRSHKIKNFLKD